MQVGNYEKVIERVASPQVGRKKGSMLHKYSSSHNFMGNESESSYVEIDYNRFVMDNGGTT